MVVINLLNKKKVEKNKYPSLFELYQLGDRVKRTHINEEGNDEVYSGIILAIKNDSLEIFWDTINGKYKPEEINNMFDNCKTYDIYDGTEKYSPIKKDKFKLFNVFKI